jgi:hypothetical protein
MQHLNDNAWSAQAGTTSYPTRNIAVEEVISLIGGRCDFPITATNLPLSVKAHGQSGMSECSVKTESAPTSQKARNRGYLLLRGELSIISLTV